jgi:hypothetical protein
VVDVVIIVDLGKVPDGGSEVDEERIVCIFADGN